MSAAPDILTLSRTVTSHDESLRALSDTVIETKIAVDRHTVELAEIKTELSQVKTVVDRHTVELAEIKTELSQVKTVVGRHTIELKKIRRTLKRHDRRFDRLEVRMDHMDGMLVEVLRRLPDPGPGG